MTTKLKIPKIRFKEFSSEWEEKKLWEVCAFFSWWTPLTSKKEYYNWNIPFIKSWEINKSKTEQFITDLWLNNSSAKLVDKWDLLYALYWATSWQVWISKINWAINQAVLCIKTKENTFFLYTILKNKKHSILEKFLQWWQWNLSADIVKSFKFLFPSLPEQQKIASFLSSVDEKIEKIKEKKKNLEEYKKWVMQKIFSQEIRFKDENWEEFGEWEEKKLGEIWETFNWLTWKTWEDFWNWNPFITYKQIFDNSKIDTSKFALVSIKYWEKQNKVKYWDIFFTVSSETPQEVWMSAVLLDEIQEDLYLNSFCFWFRIKSFDVLSPEFTRFYFRYQDIRKKIIILAQWSTRYNISKSEMMKIKINLPTLKEQEKIADFLFGIDEKIEKVSDELEKMEEFKKGLLQGMFV